MALPCDPGTQIPVSDLVDEINNKTDIGHTHPVGDIPDINDKYLSKVVTGGHLASRNQASIAPVLYSHVQNLLVDGDTWDGLSYALDIYSSIPYDYAHAAQFVSEYGSGISCGTSSTNSDMPGLAATSDDGTTSRYTYLSATNYGLLSNGEINAPGYNHFTGSVDAVSSTVYDDGDIVSVDDTIIVGQSNVIPVVSRSNTDSDKAVIGVYSGSNTTVDKMLKNNYEIVIPLDNDGNFKYTDMYSDLLSIYSNDVSLRINISGISSINVSEVNGDIQIGDYLTSTEVAGKAGKQVDDTLHSYTVAKALNSVVWANERVGVNGVTELDGYKVKTITCRLV